MEQLMSLLSYIQNNWTDILSGITMIIGGASVLVKLTPTTKDDEILGKIKNILSVIALNPKQSQKV